MAGHHWELPTPHIDRLRMSDSEGEAATAAPSEAGSVPAFHPGVAAAASRGGRPGSGSGGGVECERFEPMVQPVTPPAYPSGWSVR